VLAAVVTRTVDAGARRARAFRNFAEKRCPPPPQVAPQAGDGVAEARELHRKLVAGVQDESRKLIGLQLRQYDSWEEALAATDEFWRVGSAHLAITHWMLHQVRSLRCLCLLEVGNRAVNAVMLIAEHLAAERQLVPRAHFQRLHTWRQFNAALSAVPEQLRQRVLDRAVAAFGPFDFDWLREVHGWLQSPGGVAQPDATNTV